jgi:hypothetical protein
MARFRKGTNDADNDGRQGGSLKTGTRFVKGTNDPDNDGNRGGSLPKGDTAMVKVKGATGAEKKVVSASREAAKSPQAAAKAQEEAKASAEPGEDAKAAPKAKQAAVDEQFAAADHVGDPTLDPIAAGVAVRGY